LKKKHNPWRSYKRRKGKIDLRRASLATLEKNLAETRKRLEDITTTVNQLQAQTQSAPFQIQGIKRQINEIDERINSLRETYQPKGALRKLLGLNELPPSVKAEVKALNTQLLTLQMEQRKLEGLGNEIQSKEWRVESFRNWLSKVEEATARKRRKKDVIIELRAAAAASATESRKVGSSVRRKLNKQPWCPYCGGPLGPDSNADHIYPLSKGGRSVPKNMVYVCSECNSMKGTLTLSGFVRKHGLDRDEIERRLDELGKEY
jgi:5-methylcytosine-specific restriction endonuclease McrA